MVTALPLEGADEALNTSGLTRRYYNPLICRQLRKAEEIGSGTVDAVRITRVGMPANRFSPQF